MSTFKITNFGGEIPRVPPRALPADGSQVNQNLLATAAEFRPLQGDKDIDAAPAGARTLYRLGRNADGSLRSDDSTGWLTDLADKNHVKGQLNDDATERTVVTWNDGLQAPRVIDAKGADRLLGVPAPASVSVNANVVDEFTVDEALAWVSDELVPALADALKTSLYEHEIGSRFNGNVPVAGTTEAHGMVHYAPIPWCAAYVVSRAQADARNLTGDDLGRVNIGAADAGFIIETGPYWGRVTDMAAFKAKLRLIETPKDGSQAFTETQIDTLADKLSKLFDPEGTSLKADRAAMDKLAVSYVKAMAEITTAPLGGGRPTEPTKPNVPEMVETWVGGDPPYELRRAPEWVAYDEAMRGYRAALAAWEEGRGEAGDAHIAGTADIALTRKSMMDLSNKIEAEYFRRKENINTLVAALIDGENLIGGEGSIIEVDPDRIVDTRFYIATYVTDWGEESAPSKVSDMLEIDQNDSVTVTVPAPPPDRHIAKWRLYRSNVGSATAAFQFVDEFLISTLSYEDKLLGEQLGEPCPTLTWLEPPFRIDSGSAAEIKPPKGPDPYLRGAVGMPNGIIAGFIDNFVAFCHPYHPYAWPVEYQITTEYPIVGLGVFGQTLFVGTQANPYLISGADSASMSAIKLPQQQACVSARSIVGVGNGVVYASPDGLCLASASGVELLTGALFAREDWQALQPHTIIAAEHEGVYYFQTAQGCWALDFAARKLGRVDLAVTAFHRDALTDGLFAVQGERIVRLFSEDRRTATWKSGRIVLPAHSALAWVQADGDQSTATPVTVRWYGDGQLRHTAELRDTLPKRLPPGRWLEHEVEIESAARITKVMLASSTAELKGA